MTGHGEKHKRLIQLLGLSALVWLALAWPAWGDDLATWRQAWFDYERELRAWCTKSSPTSLSLCMQQEMAKHGVSPDFFTKLRQPREEPPPRVPDRDKRDKEQNPQSARRNNFLGEQISRWLLLLSENLSASNYPGATKNTVPIIALVIFCGWVGLYHLRNYLRTRRATKARETMPCQHGVTGAGQNPTKCPACVREDQQRRDAARRQAQAEQERREAEQAQQYAAWVARIRSQEYLQAMDPREFELLVCELFRRLGYEVEATPYGGDNGVDGYLRKNGALSILQCKRVKGSVGEPVLRDLFGTIQHAKATLGIVVTTGQVSKQARRWVQGKPIHIVELAELCRLLAAHFSEDDIVPATFKASGRHDTLCPCCGKPQRVVNSRRGRFIGCTGYTGLPQCRYTRPAW